MKHKLTVLACVGLALLLSTGVAFAQNNTITIESKNVNRCANASVGVNLINGDVIDGIGLPLKVTGGTVTAAASTARLAGFTLAQGGIPGAAFILNAVGGSVAAGAGNIYTLTVPIPSACTGTIDIDTAFYPPAGEVLLLSGCCPVTFAFNKGVLTFVNQAPVCGTNSDVTTYYQTPIVNKQLNASDADVCDGLTYSLVSPPAGATVTADGKFNWAPTCADVATSPHTITFKATDPCGAFTTCTFKVTVTQNGPVCSAVAPQSVHFNSTLSILLPATDDGCPGALSWTLNSVAPPVAGTLSINPVTGRLTYNPVCADIAGSPHTVTYTVSDGVKTCQSTVDITVTNTAPTLVCPNPVDPAHLCNHQLIDGGDGIFNVGDLVSGTAVGSDLDGDVLTYSVVSIHKNGDPGAVPHNAPTINPSTGAFSWLTSAALPSEVGTWTIVLQVSDGCATATCSFQVTLQFAFYVSLTSDAGADTIPVLSGGTVCAYLNIGPDYPLGGIDILLCYDASAMSFLQPAVAQNDLAKWEYFTFRTGANGNCSGGGCPTGLIRLVAIADLDNGPLVHPPASAFGLEGQVVKLCFKVTDNRLYIDQCIPISFCTFDCGDNVLSSQDGYTTFMALGTDTAACNVHGKPGHFLVPNIHFCDAQICIRRPPDDRGDINLDGVANSIADAVLFSRYFIEGPSVFNTPYPQVQILATEINGDGVVLTVADLVYLVRIITGDAQPYPPSNPKLTPYANSAQALINVGSDRVNVMTNSAVDLGGAVFTFRYSGLTVGTPVLGSGASQMVVSAKAASGELKVLVAPSTDARGARINAGTNEVLSIPTSGNGTIELVSVEMSDAQGALVSTSVSKGVPSEYALMQNYPNPFNAGTVIAFSLKEASDWKLSVYNITGQTVRTFSGNGSGQVQVNWDGTDNAGNAIASGVYFYRLDTKNFTATKKMTLMK